VREHARDGPVHIGSTGRPPGEFTLRANDAGARATEKVGEPRSAAVPDHEHPCPIDAEARRDFLQDLIEIRDLGQARRPRTRVEAATTVGLSAYAASSATEPRR